MMTTSSRVALAAFASLFLMSSAIAQTPAPAPAAKTEAAPAAAPKEKKAQEPRTPESLACSAEADGKGIKGKERHKFMRKCNKEAKAAAAKK
jgi:uncharacterized membrane protein YebE (DUF533 family)